MYAPYTEYLTPNNFASGYSPCVMDLTLQNFANGTVGNTTPNPHPYFLADPQSILVPHHNNNNMSNTTSTVHCFMNYATFISSFAFGVH